MSLGDRVDDVMPLLWFAFTVAAVWALAQSGLLGQLLDRLRKFGVGSASVEFTEDSAKATRQTITEVLVATSGTIDEAIARQVTERKLRSKLEDLLVAHPFPYVRSYRATVHIADPLLDDYLYQMVNYLKFSDGAANNSTGGDGAGRRFSLRTGLIGLAARTIDNESRLKATVTEIELMERWSMTRQEAHLRVSSHAATMVATVIRHHESDEFRAVLYLDSKAEAQGTDANGDPLSNDSLRAAVKQWSEELQTSYRASPLCSSLEEAIDVIMPKSPRIKIGDFG